MCNKPDRWITIPYSREVNAISRQLESIGVRIVTNAGQKIKDIIERKEKNEDSEKSIAYEVPFSGC